MNTPVTVNPDGKLLHEIEHSLFFARKAKPLWAKLLTSRQEVETLEGLEFAEAGDFLCRGVHDELWPQQAGMLLSNYEPTDEFDKDGWQRFAPRPNAALVQATQLDYPFIVLTPRGQLNGKAGDYVVQSVHQPQDVWIVDRDIFEVSYDRVSCPT